MNIFRTSDSPILSAAALDNVRVAKMALETAQILSTVLRTRGINGRLLYKPTHKHHPCVVWAGLTQSNFNWLLAHGRALAAEYRHRFDREHGSALVIEEAATFRGRLVDLPATAMQFCGPDGILPHAPVTERYRALLNQKWREAKRPPRWANRTPPEWKVEEENK